MKAIAEIAVSFAPTVLAGIFPFIRLLRGGRVVSSFFLCWGLLIFWTFVFAIAPVVAALVSTSFSHDLDSWMPELRSVLAMTVFGWFPAAITVLADLIGVFVRRLTRAGILRMRVKLLKGERTGIIVLSILTAVGTAWLSAFPVSPPPSESDLLQNFYKHRSTFEQLRDMLQADHNISRIAPWGIECREGIVKPPAGDFPVERFDNYLSLLNEVGGKVGYRMQGGHPEIAIVLWGHGFAGSTVHVGICWNENVPARQVANLDVYYHDHKSSGTTGWVYRHIDENWYLFTDIATGY